MLVSRLHHVKGKRTRALFAHGTDATIHTDCKSVASEATSAACAALCLSVVVATTRPALDSGNTFGLTRFWTELNKHGLLTLACLHAVAQCQPLAGVLLCRLAPSLHSVCSVN